MSAFKTYIRTHTNPPVFFVSMILTVTLVVWGLVAPADLGYAASATKEWISTYFGWWYMTVVFAFLVFVIILMFSRFGHIRIGKDDDRPEWGTWSWFSMMFTAGMGIGLVYYGVAEPIFHFKSMPLAENGTADAAIKAMDMTIFHWGLHPWAVYIVLGLSMGYFCFRHDLPMRPASAFYPLIGNGIYGWVGHIIDILAVFGTLFGLATSLGLGATQINAGLHILLGVKVDVINQLLIIGAITAVAVTSLMMGLDKGIRRLSLVNMYMAILLAAIVFLVGPTLFILEYMVQSVGYYLQHLPATSLRIFAFSKKGHEWIDKWTLFYWGWWISWSPFVGMFIARVSRGRTIREFIVGTLFAPVGATVVWFCIFGGTAIHFVYNGGNPALSNAGEANAMFILLRELPVSHIMSMLLSILAILVVAIFFATSSDSGSFVVDMLTNGGDPHPIWQQRLFWAVTEGVVAGTLLVAGAMAVTGNPLTALQTAAITSGLPFSIVLVFMCWGLYRQLHHDHEYTPPPGKSGLGRTENSS